MTNSRAAFVGKASPVQFFWGAMDLACTRFSGRSAPMHPGGAPNCPDWVMAEGYSRELSSCGFWPGGGKEGAFYPTHIRSRRVSPPTALNQTPPTTATNSKNSCCLTRPCAPPMTPTARSRGSCSPRTRRPPSSAAGTAAYLNATRTACGSCPCAADSQLGAAASIGLNVAANAPRPHVIALTK